MLHVEDTLLRLDWTQISSTPFTISLCAMPELHRPSTASKTIVASPLSTRSLMWFVLSRLILSQTFTKQEIYFLPLIQTALGALMSMSCFVALEFLPQWQQQVEKWKYVCCFEMIVFGCLYHQIYFIYCSILHIFISSWILVFFLLFFLLEHNRF